MEGSIDVHIDELIKELLDIREKYGNLEIVGADNYDLEFVEVQKYVKTSSEYNDIISRQTEDMDETWLEDTYVDGAYKNIFVSQGICAKIY